MKINNYGDVYATGLQKTLIAENYFGSYQGDYIITLANGDTIELYKGGYGSCSGCDWLEAEKDWETGEIGEEKIKEYLKDEKPFAIIPKETMQRVDLDTFITFLPANTRADVYDFNAQELYDEIRKNLSTPSQSGDLGDNK